MIKLQEKINCQEKCKINLKKCGYDFIEKNHTIGDCRI